MFFCALFITLIGATSVNQSVKLALEKSMSVFQFKVLSKFVIFISLIFDLEVRFAAEDCKGIYEIYLFL